ncbi:MAG: PD40 domain-containing protein [Bacteroidales bacterium]|nr:PD40 domain-containing protein [Bacteroidales bacterium]MBQ9722582.1 PD40 domain-containing protein [Bacteroidales bacterium]
MRHILATLTAISLLLVSCNRETVLREELPHIFPDYIGVTVPAGIAPLNFRLPEEYTKVFAKVSDNHGNVLTAKGRYADFNVGRWHRLTEANRGDTLTVTVAGYKDGKWEQFRSFMLFVSHYPLDDYGMTYRKFAPGYETYSKIGIYQRNIHNFDEYPIVEGTLLPGQCMGCHTANATSPEQFLFHLRGKHGATVVQTEGQRKWLETKTDRTIAKAVYSYWHPSGDYVAHSNNKIHQLFWTGNNERYIEVYDDASDVIVHNVRNDQYILEPLLMTEDFETYPAFSSDGKTLYFCSAPKVDVPAQAEDVHYNLCSISFDREAETFGNQVDTLINAVALGKSVTFPRPSYDGRWLLYSYADFGCFPINHKEADLWLMDLQDGSTHPLERANSSYCESFHNWSSDSHWILFASRRGDSLYSRIYIAQIDENGNASKPFLLPQKDPDFYHKTLFTFNVPDFTSEKVNFRIRGAYEEAFSDERVQVTVKE